MNFNIFTGFSELLLAILLGVVQGLTEFLPISSTAHLRLVSGLFGGKDIGLTASNIIQFGTLLAILQYFRVDLQVFWQRIWEILGDKTEMQKFVLTFQNWIKGGTQEVEIDNKNDSKTDLNEQNVEQNNKQSIHQSKKEVETKIENNLQKDLENKAQNETQGKIQTNPQNTNHSNFETDILLSQLIIGTIPIVVLGFLLKNFAESNRNIGEIGFFMIIGAVLLAFGEYFYLQTSKLKHSKIQTFGETLLIGFFQSMAIFPGMSRSGSTLAGSLFVGRNRMESVRFVFLLSIPALFLSGILDFLSLIRDIFKNGIAIFPNNNFASSPKIQLSIVSLLISFSLAYVVGLACLRWLLRFLSKNTNLSFIIYRIFIGFCLILFSFIAAFLGNVRF